MMEVHSFIASEMGDIDVFSRGQEIHLFHLVLPNHDRVAHHVSTDGLTWKQLPSALTTGQPGQCDDDMIWTMQTVEHPAPDAHTPRYWMYYTGASLAEGGNHQRVALATSDDLIHWRKHESNPILQPSPPHYLADLSVNGIVSFRDPYVMIEDGVWSMFVTGRQAEGARFSRGCVAYATSRDGVKWELQPPVFAPRQFEDLEVISMLKRAGRYHLFFGEFGRAITHYRHAAKLGGPWLTPPSDVPLPIGNYVFRFCDWRGQTLVYHWLRAECDWPRRTPGPQMFLPPPKVVEEDEAGRLVLRPFGHWSPWHRGQAIALPAVDHPAEVTTGAGAPAALHPDAGRQGGRRITWFKERATDFILEFDLTLLGQAGGIVFRSDAGVENTNWLTFEPDTRTATLKKQQMIDSAFHRYKLRQTVVQTATLPTVLPGQDAACHVRLLACGPYIELSVDNIVVLSAITYKACSDRIGLFTEDASASAKDISLQPLTCPWKF